MVFTWVNPGGGGSKGPGPHPFFGPRCRLFNIGPKVGPPPFKKSWIRPCIYLGSAHYHIMVHMGAGLAGRPPCLSHSQALMGAGLAGRPPCLSHSQALMGAGLAVRSPCLAARSLWVLG